MLTQLPNVNPSSWGLVGSNERRLEDLGRIAVFSRNVLDLAVWDLYQGRKKDFVDYVETLEEEAKYDLLHALIYGLEEVKEGVCEICLIAEGLDRLNEPES